MPVIVGYLSKFSPLLKQGQFCFGLWCPLSSPWECDMSEFFLERNAFEKSRRLLWTVLKRLFLEPSLLWSQPFVVNHVLLRLTHAEVILSASSFQTGWLEKECRLLSLPPLSLLFFSLSAPAPFPLPSSPSCSLPSLLPTPPFLSCVSCHVLSS